MLPSGAPARSDRRHAIRPPPAASVAVVMPINAARRPTRRAGRGMGAVRDACARTVPAEPTALSKALNSGA